MKKIFVCSPYRGDIEKNIANVKKYCKFAGIEGIPIAPHLYFTQFLNEKTHRWKGISWGMELLKECDEVYVFADEVSEGMIVEIRRAKALNIPIHFYNSQCKEIRLESLLSDNTIGVGYKTIIVETVNPDIPKYICPHADECRIILEFFNLRRGGKRDV